MPMHPLFHHNLCYFLIRSFCVYVCSVPFALTRRTCGCCSSPSSLFVSASQICIGSSECGCLFDVQIISPLSNESLYHFPNCRETLFAAKQFLSCCPKCEDLHIVGCFSGVPSHFNGSVPYLSDLRSPSWSIRSSAISYSITERIHGISFNNPSVATVPNHIFCFCSSSFLRP